VGCLVQDGKLRNLDAKALPYIPQWKGTDYGSLRIRDLVEGGRVGCYDPAPIGSLFSRPDPIGYLAKQRNMAITDRASYSLDAAVFLAPVITGLAGERADTYVVRRLFKPLGITTGRWRRFKSGVPDTATGLWLRPADLVKIGALLLNDGRWNGQQVLPPGWVRAATTPEGARQTGMPPGLPDMAVGHFLKVDAGGFETLDFVGQTLFVHPGKRLVAVRTVAWDGRPVTRNPVQFEFDDLTERIAACF
jgi:CubicO group peptidase (beta-lactamase class C family)